MTATIYARADDLERRRQLDALATAHRHGETEARVYAAQVERMKRMGIQQTGKKP